LEILINNVLQVSSINYVTATNTTFTKTFEAFIAAPGAGDFNFKVTSTATSGTSVRIFSKNSIVAFAPGGTTFFALGVKK
jgi:hypothetical protein